MRPLLFLAARSFGNNCKHAIKDPVRALWFLLEAVVVTLLLISSYRKNVCTAHLIHFEDPQGEAKTLFLLVFAVYLVFSFISAWFVPTSFRPADSEILMVVPINQRRVLLSMILHQSLGRWWVHSIVILVLLRDQIFRLLGASFLKGQGFLYLAGLGAFFLSLLFVNVVFGNLRFLYRLNLSAHRIAPRQNWWPLLLTLIGFGALAVIGIQGFGGYILKCSKALSFLEITESDISFLVRGFSGFAIGILTSNASQLGMSMAFYVGALLLSLVLVSSRSQWLNELVAERAAIIKEKALGGKKSRVIKKAEKTKESTTPYVMQKLTLRRSLAIVWKDFLVIWRSSKIGVLVLFVVAILASLMTTPLGQSVLEFLSKQKLPTQSITLILHVFFGLTLFLVTIFMAHFTSKTGHLELLKCVDLQKPLPFSPMRIIFCEIFAKALPGILSVIVASIISLVFAPLEDRGFVVGVLRFLPCFMVLIVTANMLTTLLFSSREGGSSAVRGIVSFLLCYVLIPVEAYLTRTMAAAHFSEHAKTTVLVGFSLAYISALILWTGKLYGSYQPST
jgi:hypothetical protein